MELLAPAGNYECFRAAMLSGADAVYLGVGERNARAFAGNFSLDEVRRALAEAHICGMSIYIALNTLVLEREMNETLELVDKLYEAGADALIIQDMGLAKLIRQNWPDFPMHASTQMSIHNAEGVHMAKDFGFSRVVLARELSMNAIQDMAKQTDIELEVFVHGAMCVSVSGQCLHSSFLGGRSGNRGQCAQPCRLPYQVEEQPPKHVLSMKDLCLLDQVERLQQIGVASLKIEGRMKPPIYVSETVRAYRNAMNPTQDRPKSKQSLLQVFNRGGFSTGYAKGREGLIDSQYNGHRGILVGVCTKKGIKLNQALDKGDIVCLGLSENKREYTIRERMEKGEHSFPTKGENGQNVWRLQASQQQAEAKEFLHRQRRTIPITMQFSANENEPCVLTMKAAGKSVTCCGEVVQKANTGGLTREKVFQQLNKLGETAFTLAEFKINLEHDGLFLSNRTINTLRRQTVEAWMEEFKTGGGRKAHQSWHMEMDKTILNGQVPLLLAQCASLEQAKAALEAGADEIYAQPRIWNEETLQGWSAFAKTAPCTLLLPPILQPDALAHIQKQMQTISIDYFQGLVCGNMGSMEAFRLFCLKQYGDYTLNVVNPWTAEAYQKKGLERVTLSPELTLPQIRDIINNVPQSEIMVYGTLPSMNLLVCPMREQNDGTCLAGCQHEKKLIDRKKEAFMLWPLTFSKGNCLVQVLNAHCMDGLKYFHELRACGAAAWRMSFYAEKPEQVYERTAAYRQALRGGAVHALPNATGGHFKRGIS